MNIYIPDGIFGKNEVSVKDKLSEEQLALIAEKTNTPLEELEGLLGTVIPRGDTIEYISKWEVESLLEDIYRLLPEPHDQYRLFGDGATCTITNNYYGQTEEDDTFVEIFFEFSYIGLTGINLPIPETKSKSDLWEKYKEHREQIFDLILESAEKLKVPVVVPEVSAVVDDLIYNSKRKRNDIHTSIQTRVLDHYAGTYIISGAGLEKEHAYVEKRIWKDYRPRTEVFRYNPQGISEELVYVTPHELFTKK